MYNYIDRELNFTTISPQDIGCKWNDALEIVFILKGEGWLRIGESKITYTVRQKDIFVVNRFQVRTLTLKGDSAALAMYIAPSLITLLCPEQTGLLFKCMSFLFPDKSQDAFNVIRRDFAQIFLAYYKNKSYLPITLRSHAGFLLANLIRYFSAPDTSFTDKGSTVFTHLRKITEYIHHNYKEEITLATLAKQSYLSTTYISHLFTKQLGKAFSSYLLDVRLSHAATLLTSGQTLTSVAEDTGFANSGAFIDAFKQQYGITPGRYRKQNKSYDSSPEELSPIFADAFDVLVEYSEQTLAAVAIEHRLAEVRELNVDVLQQKRNLKHKWHTVLNAGYARDLKTSEVRRQLEKAQQDIGYKFIRFKGCLDDEMATCIRVWDSGQIAYNFVMIDECIDLIQSFGAKPWLELNHMPTALARKSTSPTLPISIPSSVTLQAPTFSPPEYIEDWLALIRALLQHLIQKYGLAEVEQWIVLPFISLSYEKYFFTREDYWHLYLETVQLLRTVIPKGKIAAANIWIDDIKLTRWFLEKCKEKNVL